MVTYSETKVNVAGDGLWNMDAEWYFITGRNIDNSQAKSTDCLALRGWTRSPHRLALEDFIKQQHTWVDTWVLDAPADSFELGLVRDRDDSGGHLGIGCSMGLLLILCRRSSLHLGSSAHILLSAGRGPSQGSTACSWGTGTDAEGTSQRIYGLTSAFTD
ncbi:hypothetical protein JB92DRAFT_2830036 [Gautieria morchelliformis]|nr:hypothetical protein JB92DRAFT_2830036 [Gautieria morchelliformis]